MDRNGDEPESIQGPLGNDISLSTDIGGYVNSLMLVYASQRIKALGNAQYLFIVAPNYNTANVRVGLGELLNGFKKAFSACIERKGYTVK